MGLSIPKEPNDLKDLIKIIRSRLRSGDDIEYDSLAVWSFNRLPKYLWEHWKEELKRKGISWQKFLKILKFHTNDIISWALRDELNWRDLVLKVIHTLTYYAKEDEQDTIRG